MPEGRAVRTGFSMRPNGAHGEARPTKVPTLLFSKILRPRSQLAVGVEGQLQHLVVVAGSDGLVRTEAVIAISGHAAIEVGTSEGLDKPFAHDFAIAQLDLPGWRAEFGHRLGIGVIPDAAVPINRRCGLAAGQKRNCQGQNDRQ